jgi:hypothetical protein
MQGNVSDRPESEGNNMVDDDPLERIAEIIELTKTSSWRSPGITVDYNKGKPVVLPPVRIDEAA